MIWKAARDKRRDPSAHRVADKLEAFPAKLVCNRNHLWRPIDEMMDNARVTVLRPAVAGQVEGHQVELRQQRCNTIEARGVVEPPVEGQYRRSIYRAPFARRETKMRELNDQITDRHRWSR